MSTQNFGHPPISFSITTPFRNVRLLEVPDDLAEILTTQSSTSDARIPILKFKSAPPPSSSSRKRPTSTAKESILHLCSENQSWAVKQVSTSNSVYIIQPSSTSNPAHIDDSGGYNHADPNVDDNGDVEMTNSDNLLTNSSVGSIIATSQVSNFLELHPVPIDESSVTRSILDLLPVYHLSLNSEEPNLDLQSANESKIPRSLSTLIDDIPAPDSVVKKCISRLCIFESTPTRTAITGSRGGGTAETAKVCQIPSARTLLDVWTEIIQTSAIEDIKLDQPMDVSRIIETLQRQTTDHDNPNTIEIARCMLKPEGLLDSLGLYHRQQSHPTSIPLSNRRFKGPETSRLTAALLLTSTTSSPSSHDHDDDRERQDQNQRRPREEFLRRWTDLVPSSFVKFCTIESLTAGPFALDSTSNGNGSDKEGEEEEGGFIRWTGPKTAVHDVAVPSDLVAALWVSSSKDDAGASAASGVPGAGAGNGVGGSGKTASTSAAASSTMDDRKRKWHEKFGAQRNSKK